MSASRRLISELVADALRGGRQRRRGYVLGVMPDGRVFVADRRQGNPFATIMRQWREKK